MAQVPKPPAESTQLAAEFQALPLEYLISAPLIAAVKAQKAAADATKGFVESMIENGKPITVDFEAEQRSGAVTRKAKVNAPLLAITPVPHLRIDSLTVHFTFEISQTFLSSSATEKGIELSASTGGALSPWVKASFKGSASSKSSKESTTNRSGQLEITVNASEAPMPEGLSRVLSLLARSIPAETEGA